MGYKRLYVWIDADVAERLDDYVRNAESVGRLTKSSVVEYAIKKFLEGGEKRG